MPQTQKQRVGQIGENAAADWYKAEGYEIIARNVHESHQEIDLIARNDQSLVFVEVKTRRTQRFGRPAAAVDHRKQQKIIQSARWFLRQRHLEGCLCRFDVIEVYRAGERWQIEHLPGAFET